MAQDDYYYEIQLTNKQLVFYFMAGASGLILSFLAGIMVGRGVDATPEVQAASGRPVVQDTIIREEPPAANNGKSAPLPTEDLKYDTLLGDKPGEAAAGAEARKGSITVPVATLPPTSARRDPVTTSRPPVTTTTTPPVSAPASAEPTGKSYTIQVGAFSQKAYADSQVSTLKKKGYAAYVVSPDGADSLFNVRVGPYTSRPAAENAQKQVASTFSLKPFIVEKP